MQSVTNDDNTNTYYVVGTASTASKFGKAGCPSTFTKVEYILDFIESILEMPIMTRRIIKRRKRVKNS